MTLTLPLPVYETVPLGEMTGKTGEAFRIVAGLDHDLVRQLREKSLDESDTELMQNTSDRERFGLGSYDEWYAKGRVPFALVHAGSGNLAALIWFGPKPLGRRSLKHLSPEERARESESVKEAGVWHTVVYRSYHPYRGAGLMKKFMRFALDAYRAAFPDARIWAGIEAANEASIGFARSFGLEVDEKQSDRVHGLVIMTEPPVARA
jgi:RimJ/RimL family protein N-acetyltransferase